MNETESESPHFDESAIAAAQPVEPLPLRASHSRFGRSNWARYWAAGLVIMLATIAVLGAYAAVRQAQDVVANVPETGIQQSSTVPAAAPPVGESNVSTSVVLTNRKSLPRRSQSPQLRMNAVEDQARPVARKVGVIIYRRSQN